ncbi:SDR family oxidoreductase [soil metagenome]
MEKLKGQVALVTGASSGIGQAIAIALGKAGAKVIVNYRSSEDGARETVEQIEEAGGEATAVQADVSKEEEVIRLFQETLGTYGGLDILIGNAGIQQDNKLTEMSLEDWQKVIDVNLTGQFLCAREAAKEFTKRGVKEGVSRAAGKIIFISSVHEKIPWAGRANYTTSKGGLMLFMQSIAQELAPQKIRVNSIAPGAIKTAINEEEWKSEEGRREMLEKIPYGRIGEPMDIGRVAAWLASDEADYIAGTTLFVDGAMTTYPSFLDEEFK